MKLNLDCVRDVLLTCENLPYSSNPSLEEITKFPQLSKYYTEEIIYSVEKLYEA